MEVFLSMFRGEIGAGLRDELEEADGLLCLWV